ncbi:histidine phosphatase family protein [Paenibacillus radicis (ex Xue et al. 2023)]|uniref:Histidine phosphatase family protein n=1 Tax=Paenibacillus radicis (ex Xue et al. 2023) TaxID=2972489 RepID=A0ABT1YMK7_9BACL|nr:histidine phosphatase family protein [Paenibacillus radicis (ex Xue et al. 2023)]MCR8633965.1 histidine phosphatase family protein [Paenibacillus radicis (ex Xue et al. 2023)]
MEIIFVRHGHGEHMVHTPDSYNVADPKLTQQGEEEAASLRVTLPLTEQDAVIASPTRYSLQTAQVWCSGTNAARFIHPAIGPRQFPNRYDFTTMPCDNTLEPPRLIELFSDFLLPSDIPAYLWLQGINTVPTVLFEKWADQFIAWCKRLDKTRIHIVSHDGTIASYMEYIRRGKLSREELPGQSGQSGSLGWKPLSI